MPPRLASLRSPWIVALPLIALPTGCASLGGGRLAEPDEIRTITSIGGSPLAVAAGEPGQQFAAEAPPPSPALDAGRSIAGRVVDDRGQPVPEATVRLAIDGAAAGRAIQASTDEAGRFTLANLRASSEYTLIAEWRDEGGELRTGRARARAPESRVEIALGSLDRPNPVRIDRVSTRNAADPAVADPASSPGDPRAESRPPEMVNFEDLPMPEASEALAGFDESPPVSFPTDIEAGRSTGGTRGWKRGDRSQGMATTVDDPLDSDPFAIPLEDDIPNPLPPARAPMATPRGMDPPGEPGSLIPNEMPPRYDLQPRSEPARSGPDVAIDPPTFPGLDDDIVPRMSDRERAVVSPVDDSTIAAPVLDPIEGMGSNASPSLHPQDGASTTAPGVGAASNSVEVAPPTFPPLAATPSAEPAAPESPAPEIADVELHEAPSIPTMDRPATPAKPPVPSELPVDETVPAPPPPATTDSPLVDRDDPLAAPRLPGEEEAVPRLPMNQEDLNASPELLDGPPDLDVPGMPGEPVNDGLDIPPPSEPAPEPEPLAGVSALQPRTWGELAAQAERTATVNEPATPSDDKGDVPDVQLASLSTPRFDAAISRASCQFDRKSQRILDFELPDLTGRSVRFQDLNSELVLIDFWGTWCGPCVRAIPHLVELQERFGSKSLRVVGIAYELEGSPKDRAVGVESMARRLGINYPVLLGEADGEPCPLQAALHVQTYPTLVLVDREGRIQWRGTGADERTLETLTRVISARVESPRNRTRTTRARHQIATAISSDPSIGTD